MDICAIIDAALTDLALVASSQPNERLPKEEQIRCSVYAALRPHYRFVCAERGYASIDDGSRIECDLWASSPNSPPIWIEFKRCWSAKGWKNKPPEQLADWEADINKLRQLSHAADRYFMLIGLFDCDPLCAENLLQSSVPRNLACFYPSRLVHSTSRSFTWREGDGLSCIGAWVWHWPAGTSID